MADEIEILPPTPHPGGGDTATVTVRYGSKEATIMLKPRSSLVAMAQELWREELEELASALKTAPIRTNIPRTILPASRNSTIDPISLKEAPYIIATVDDARKYINNFVSNSSRAEPHWDKAISDLNAQTSDDRFTDQARKSVFEALKHEQKTAQ
jgi:hypothetical protein